MKKISITKIKDCDINFYLNSRNLIINRKYSLNSNKISNIDHYNWWFNQKRRKSFIVKKEGKKIIILTEDCYNIKKIKFLTAGFISCVENISVFDSLQAIKWQNRRLAKFKNAVCFLTIHKKNYFGKLHVKFYGYLKLKKKNKFFDQINSIAKVDKKFSYFYKIIS